MTVRALLHRWRDHTLRHGATLNSYDLFKLIALIAMIIDHAGFYLAPEIQEYRIIGRIAFPLFLFLVGYSRSWRFDRWLLGAAVLVSLTGWLLHYDLLPLNILFTILATRFMLALAEPRGMIKADIFYMIALIIWLVPMTLLFDYGSFALMYASLGYWKRTQAWNRQHDVFLAATLVMQGLWNLFSIECGIVGKIAIVAIMLGLGRAMRGFRMYPILLPMEAKPAETFAVLIARNSLLIYAAHVIAFMAIGRLITLSH